MLAGVVNITNDQLLGAKLQTTVDYLDYILVTVNQLPKGHTSPPPPKDYEMDDNENLAQCGKHKAELLSVRFNAVYLEGGLWGYMLFHSGPSSVWWGSLHVSCPSCQRQAYSPPTLFP